MGAECKTLNSRSQGQGKMDRDPNSIEGLIGRSKTFETGVIKKGLPALHLVDIFRIFLFHISYDNGCFKNRCSR